MPPRFCSDRRAGDDGGYHRAQGSYQTETERRLDGNSESLGRSCGQFWRDEISNIGGGIVSDKEISDGGVGIGTLFHTAKQNGYQCDSNNKLDWGLP